MASIPLLDRLLDPTVQAHAAYAGGQGGSLVQVGAKPQVERARERLPWFDAVRYLGYVSREIARRGALDVLRNGVKDSGCKFRLASFRPASGLIDCEHFVRSC